MKISIIVPVYDRRNAGWKALESALNQDFPADRFEVVAVMGKSAAAAWDASEVDPLFARCTTVVHSNVNIDDVANEVLLYAAGYERSTGDLLFFMEGHTVLQRQCCAVIDAYFRRHPESAVAWAPRFNHGASALGALISTHNLRHERRAAVGGVFSFGATSVIRRSLLERLGGLDAHYLRFSETALFHCMRREGIAIGRIAEPLCTHFNDMSVGHWRKLVMSAGEAKCNYYNALLTRGEDVRAHVRHAVYLVANRAWSARLLYPLFRVAGSLCLALGLGAWRVGKPLAYPLYVLGLGFTDLSGFCRARTRAPKIEAHAALTQRTATKTARS